MQGYEALREHAAWLDLSARGRIRMTGEDRVRLLHAMSSQHIQQMRAGDGCYAFFLNAQGRILADAVVLALDEALLLDAEQEARAFVYEHLDRYIIADDVTLEDLTDTTIQIGIEGPESEAILRGLGAPLPAAPYSHADWNGRTVLRMATTGIAGFSIIAPADERDVLITALGIPHADAEAANVVRIENAVPRFDAELNDRHLPHEAQVLSAVNFNKGCYLGQEIVERVRTRGGVHRFLVALELDGETPAPDAKITAGEKELGEITSSAFSPARGKTVALGYVRLQDIPQGTELAVNGHTARVTATKPLRAD